MAPKQKKTAKQRGPVWYDAPLLDEQDRYLFNEGNHFDLWKKLGAHPREVDGAAGINFAVWAPNAHAVRVMGDFNGWDKESHELRGSASGIWEGFVPDLEPGVSYKFHICGPDGYRVDKADPFSRFQEVAPKTASIVWRDDYAWQDEAWMEQRGARIAVDAPVAVYELHPGSWMRDPSDPERLLSYRELAPKIAEYCDRLGFTHVELLPIMEHPFYGSWGYQSTGYFAPSSRYGTPEDFKFFVDHLHQQGLGVILDWVPSHFPSDEFALAYFDGTHLFEHADPRQGYHPDWNSYIFNYGRNEVRAFLISSALYWLEEFHIDGLRVDAVASMLYLDYSRKEGEWIPNELGGRENLEAISFLKQLNEVVYGRHPDVQTIAEESTSWPKVSRPTYDGGLGFGMKWDMGWMHDTLTYMQKEPIHRQWHHHELTFRMIYAFNENFMLPLSHDEVVHGKGSILDKMPGDEWQKFGNLRLLYSYMWASPGKKLLFMGSEFGQWKEWNHDQSLDWHLTEYDRHEGVQELIADLNRLYREVPALHARDFDPDGFEWIDGADRQNSVLSFLRKAPGSDDPVLVVLNFTPMPRHNYRVGVPHAGVWEEIFNSDADLYGGSGVGNMGEVETTPVGCHGRYQSLNLTLPPLGALFLRRRSD